MVVLTCLILLILISLLARYVYNESNGYHVVKYNIVNSKIKKDHVSFVFISDLHNKQYGKCNEDILEEIKLLNPDMVIFGGDMITSCMEKWVDYSDTISFVKSVAELFPVYYGMGNHEERLRRRPEKFPKGEYERLSKALASAGAPIIINERRSNDELNIDIYGLDLDHDFYRKVITKHFPDDYLVSKLGTVDKNKLSILIAHNPEHFIQYSDYGVDLVLSGHVHGGIVRLPFLGGVVSPALKLFPKYDGGLFTHGNSTMILSRGLGSHTVPIRVNNKAEVIYVEISKYPR